MSQASVNPQSLLQNELRDDDCNAKANVRCYNCHKVGHVSQVCPRPKMTICYNCRQEGHKTFECLKGKRCHGCNQLDHVARDCPRSIRNARKAILQKNEKDLKLNYNASVTPVSYIYGDHVKEVTASMQGLAPWAARDTSLPRRNFSVRADRSKVSSTNVAKALRAIQSENIARSEAATPTGLNGGQPDEHMAESCVLRYTADSSPPLPRALRAFDRITIPPTLQSMDALNVHAEERFRDFLPWILPPSNSAPLFPLPAYRPSSVLPNDCEAQGFTPSNHYKVESLWGPKLITADEGLPTDEAASMMSDSFYNFKELAGMASLDSSRQPTPEFSKVASGLSSINQTSKNSMPLLHCCNECSRSPNCNCGCSLCLHRQKQMLTGGFPWNPGQWTHLENSPAALLPNTTTTSSLIGTPFPDTLDVQSESSSVESLLLGSSFFPVMPSNAKQLSPEIGSVKPDFFSPWVPTLSKTVAPENVDSVNNPTFSVNIYKCDEVPSVRYPDSTLEYFTPLASSNSLEVRTDVQRVNEGWTTVTLQGVDKGLHLDSFKKKEAFIAECHNRSSTL